ncbi:DDE-type integrase/transposase/recombinase [Streptomyces sp. 6N223]|uniref:DDE-type integrase/transposase/recombinase n=1 Tax=Streptomyces sp. 6N223 TaxID=3457412 RepID=UPI003FCEE94D
MASLEEEDRRRAEKARQVALFRYSLIQDLLDPTLSTRQRGALCRRIAAAEHTDPFGRQVRVSRNTLDRWARYYRTGGFAALVPEPRKAVPRTPPEVLELAVALKKEKPERTAAQVRRILRQTQGWSPTDRTLQRHFAEAGLNVPPATQTGTFGRFEATRANELWTGDALHGPKIAGRKTYLFAFIDDHSRAIVGHRFGYSEDTVRLAAALRPALAARGVPESIYVDNGSAFVDTWLLRACASLAIRLTHSRPGRPQGRGKIERFFRTVRDQFLVELDDAATERIASLAELNRLFTAWVETVYHRTVHSETTQAPIERWLASIPRPLPLPSPADLREAFLWSETRTVTKTATVSLHGNTYQVDPALARMKVELVFDPFDLADIEVRHRGRTLGKAVAHTVGRHTHPKATAEIPAQPKPDTGIDYLRILGAEHDARTAHGINYASLLEDHTRENHP